MPDHLVDALAASRERTFAIVAHLDDAELERQIDPLMSPLVWDLGHIAAYEDLWLVHRFAGEPLLHPELAALYDAFETPRAVRGEIELLDADGAREYLADRARAHAGRDRRPRHRPRRARAGRCATSSSTPRRCARRCAWAALLAPGEPGLATLDGGAPLGMARHPRRRPRRWAPPDDGFAYDNERPRHGVELAPVPHRAPAGHQRDLAALHRGRRLRAPRVVERRGLGVEGGLRHRALSGRRGGTPGRSGVPRLLVRGRRLRPLARGTAPH